MDSNKILDIQNQVRENSEDLQKYLSDLECWEKEVKMKEEELKLIRTTSEEVPFIYCLFLRVFIQILKGDCMFPSSDSLLEIWEFLHVN